MNIKEIISKHYDELHQFCNPDLSRSMSKTDEDILHDVFIRAMKKYSGKDVDEVVAMDYLRLTLYSEQHIQPRRVKKTELVLMGDSSQNFTEHILFYDKNLENIDIST